MYLSFHDVLMRINVGFQATRVLKAVQESKELQETRVNKHLLASQETLVIPVRRDSLELLDSRVPLDL